MMENFDELKLVEYDEYIWIRLKKLFNIYLYLNKIFVFIFGI